MNTYFLTEINEVWENFKGNFSEKSFPNEFIQNFFMNTSIASIENVSENYDGSWAFYLQLKNVENNNTFSFVLNRYGFVGNLSGECILKTLKGSEIEKWGIINRIFEGFYPLFQQRLNFAKKAI